MIDYNIIATGSISIHALREEGDAVFFNMPVWNGTFLSTPSARRATGRGGQCGERKSISIHALREEGDDHRSERDYGH